MRSSIRKPKKLTDKEIEKLFQKNLIVSIDHIDRSEELRHLLEVNNATKNIHYKQCTKYNFDKITKNKVYRVIFKYCDIIAKKGLSNEHILPKDIIDKYNVNNIPIGDIKWKLNYNLFELPYFNNETFPNKINKG